MLFVAPTRSPHSNSKRALTSIAVAAITISVTLGRTNIVDATELLYVHAQALQEEMLCSQKDALSRAFCFQSMVSARKEHLGMVLDVLDACQYSRLQDTAFDLEWAMANGLMSKTFSEAPFNSTAIYARSAGSGKKTYTSTETSYETQATEYLMATVEHCTRPALSEGQQWTAQRLGPMRGFGGYDWHSFAWNDAGQFRENLAAGPVWVLAYAFLPVTSANRPLGVPPIHIHHQHTTSGQDLFDSLKGLTWGHPNRYGTTGVEFDTHGDRQCHSAQGGVACLVSSLPPGFGMKVEWAMQTVGELNDVRPLDSPALSFYVSHTWLWTKTPPARQVGRLLTGIAHPHLRDIARNPAAYQSGSTKTGAKDGGGGNGTRTQRQHESSLLEFDPSSKQMAEYLMWGELNFAPYNLTTFDHFWHTHHEFTADMWLLAGPSTNYGLGEGTPFWDRITNLTPLGLDIEGAAQLILSHIRLQSTTCAAGRGSGSDGGISERLQRPDGQAVRRVGAAPAAFGAACANRLLCIMDQRRLESVSGQLVPRMQMASCGAMRLGMNDVVTMVSFHKSLMPIASIVHHYQHAAWYAYYVADQEGETIPNMIYDQILPDFQL